jgi:hypothetical protein
LYPSNWAGVGLKESGAGLMLGVADVGVAGVGVASVGVVNPGADTVLTTDAG